MAAKRSVRITTAAGSVYRWGPEEWEVLNIPQALTYGSTIPGGFKTATIVLPRRIDIDYPDLNLGDHVEILGRGNKILWEGRVHQLPRSHGTGSAITVGAVGYQAHLADDQSFREIYVSRDLSEWKEVGAAIKIAFGTNFTSAGFSVTPDSTNARPCISLQIEGQWTTQRPISVAMLDPGPGVTIAEIDYDFALSTTEATFLLELVNGDNDAGAGDVSLGDLATGSASGAGTLKPTKRVLRWQWFHSGAGGAAGVQYRAMLRYLAWFGNHGVPIQGERPNRGVLGSDVMADVLGRAAPLINFTTGAGGSIRPTSYVIPHLSFPTPTTPLEVIMKANAYTAWDWAIWDDRTFYLTEPDSSQPLEARLSEGAQLDLEGATLDEVYNGIFGTYQDAAGISHTVGPPGSNADTEDATLADTSATNTINAHNMGRKYFPLPISVTTTPEGAVAIAALQLADKALPQRTGQLVVTGTITHPTKGEIPVEEIRAGEWVRVSDHPADVPRKILEATYDAGSDSCTCSFGNSTLKLDAIVERLGTAQVGRT